MTNRVGGLQTCNVTLSWGRVVGIQLKVQRTECKVQSKKGRLAVSGQISFCFNSLLITHYSELAFLPFQAAGDRESLDNPILREQVDDDDRD